MKAKSKRVKNPHPVPPVEPIRERIKSGASEESASPASRPAKKATSKSEK